MEFCNRFCFKSYIFIAFFSSFFVDSIKGDDYTSHPGMKYLEIIRIFVEVDTDPNSSNFDYSSYQWSISSDKGVIKEAESLLKKNRKPDPFGHLYGAHDRYVESFEDVTVNYNGQKVVLEAEEGLTVYKDYKNDRGFSKPTRVLIYRYVISLVELKCDGPERMVCQNELIPYQIVPFDSNLDYYHSIITSVRKKYTPQLGANEDGLNKEFNLVVEQDFGSKLMKDRLSEIFWTSVSGLAYGLKYPDNYPSDFIQVQVSKPLYWYDSGGGYFVLSPPKIDVDLNPPKCNGGSGTITLSNFPSRSEGVQLRIDIIELVESSQTKYECNYYQDIGDTLCFKNAQSLVFKIDQNQSSLTLKEGRTDINGTPMMPLTSGYYKVKAFYYAEDSDGKNKFESLCSVNTIRLMTQPDPLNLDFDYIPIKDGSPYHTIEPGGTGSVKLIASGGREAATYKYRIGTNASYVDFVSNDTLADRVSGNVIHLSNSDACTETYETIEFTEPEALTIEINDEAENTKAPTCSSTDNVDDDTLKNNGQITFTTSGGVGENSYKLLKKGNNDDWSEWSDVEVDLEEGDDANTIEGLYSGLPNGIYKVAVTDDAEISADSDEVSLIRNAVAVGLTTDVFEVDCNGGSTTITFEGFDDSYSYFLNGADYDDIRSEELLAGSHEIVISKDGCSKTLNFEVNQPSTLLDISIQEADITPDVCEQSNGRVAFSIVGGKENDFPYYVTIEGDDMSIYRDNQTVEEGDVLTNLSFDGLSAGQYTLKVYSGTNSPNGARCTAETSVTIDDYNPLSGLVDVDVFKEESCQGNRDAVIEISGIADINDNYKLFWGTNEDEKELVSVDEDNRISGLTEGTYYLWVEENDERKCMTSKMVEVSIIDNPITITSVNQTIFATCETASNGAVSVVTNGGVGLSNEFIYSRSPEYSDSEQSGNVLSGLHPSTYTFFVKDVAGCIAEFPDFNVTASAVHPLSWEVPSSEPATCSVAANGSIVLTEVSHSANKALTYFLNEESVSGSDEEVTAFFENLIPGVYTVKVSDSDGCYVEQNVTVGSNDKLPQLSFHEEESVTCAGMYTGRVSVTIDNFDSNLSPYDVTAAVTVLEAGDDELEQPLVRRVSESGFIISNLTDTTYTISVRDAFGCSSEEEYTPSLLEPALSLSETWIDAPCEKAMGTIIMSAEGGVSDEGDYEFKFGDDFIGNGPELTISRAIGVGGRIRVIDSAGCEVVGVENRSVLLRDNPVEIGWAGSVSPACIGGDDGSIVFEIQGDSELAYSYFLFNRANPTEVLTGPITDEIPGRVSIEGLSAGVYDLMVVEAPLDSDSSEEDMRAGCWSEYNGIEVEDYDSIVVESFSNNYIEYFGDESGSMEVTITGGSQSYEYRIVNADDETHVFGSGKIGEGRFQKDGLPAGNYLFLFKDVNNCAYFEGGAIWDEHPFTIAQPDEALTLEVRLEDDLLCYESEDGRIEVEARGGWGPHYTYKLEGPVDFDWQQEGVFESLPAGTYSLFIKDSREVEHVFDNEFTLTQPAPFSVEVTRTKDATCPGYNNGELDVVSTNGVYSGDGLIYRVFDTGREEVVAINGGAEWHYNKLSEGTYSIVVSDENQCADSASFSIGEPEQVEIDIEHNYIRAKNHATGEVSFEISKGNGYYEYTWGLEEAERPIASGTTEGALNFDGLFAGNYVLMVRDTARCHFEGDSEWMVRSILMREPELELGIEVLVDSVTCNGLGDGELALSGLGGWGSYVYSFEGAPFSSQPSIDNLEPGTYNIAVRDSAGIIYERSVEVFEPEVLAVDDVASLTHVSCFGGSNGKIALNVTGGNNAYLVSADQLFWQEGTEVQNLPAGAFSVFVKDVKGCETSGGPFTLTEPSKIALDTHFVEESTCNLAEGSISASFKGGVGQYTYTWYKELLLSDGTFDTDTLTEFTSSSINKLYAGRYIVDVQDENGCEVSFPFDVNDNTDLTILTIDTYPVSCYGYNDGAAKAEIAFGNPPYNLTWRGQGLEVLQDSASNFSAGEHHLSVYDDKRCYVSQYFVIGTPDSLFYQITEQVQPLCLGGAKGSIEIAGTGGTAPYRFEWDNGTQAAALGNIDPGTYRVVMTDSHDCVSSFDFDFDYQRIVQPFVGRDTLICHYNTLMLDGGDYARFAWHATSGFTSTNRLVEVNQPATYFLEVADGDNCIGFDSITVDVSVLEITGVSTKDLSCAGLANGEASITINSTSDNYNVQWPGGSNGMSVSGYSGGDYTVSAINEFGCSDTLHFSLFEPDPLSITASYNEPLCLGVSDGYIRPVVSGGVGDYRYSWSTGESKRELSRLSQGVYVFTVADANDCWLSDEYNLVYKRILLPDLGGDKVVCQGNSVSLNPGSFHKLSWYHDEEFASTDSVFDAHLPGSYVVVVNDEDNCIGRDSVHVDVLGAALLPSFLMATSVPLGDTLLIVEVTQPKPKSIDWEIGGSHRIVERGEYFAKVIFDEEGVFPVTLSSYADEGCMGQERKSILVTSASPQNEQGENVYQQQNLISLEVSPNPSQGEFNALVKMHEAAPVTFYLVRIDTGQIYETRKRQGLAEYNELFTHNGVGQFVVFVESAGERLMQKIIVF